MNDDDNDSLLPMFLVVLTECTRSVISSHSFPFPRKRRSKQARVENDDNKECYPDSFYYSFSVFIHNTLLLSLYLNDI